VPRRLGAAGTRSRRCWRSGCASTRTAGPLTVGKQALTGDLGALFGIELVPPAVKELLKG